MNDPKNLWTREESRYADGRVDGEARRRLERRLAEDPRRRERLESWQEAMDLWREDTRIASSRFAPPRLAARILDGRGGTRQGTNRAAWRYAAAAVILLATGLVGSAVLGPDPAHASYVDIDKALQILDEDRLEHQVRMTWELRPFVGQHLPERDR